jgi:VIT1/CCC1 family predicted Fe2+/Mn2+ transporter
MKSSCFRIIHLPTSILVAYFAYALFGFVLDKLSELFERGTIIRNVIETLLAILAPTTFGLLVLVALVIVFYWLLPKWFSCLSN